MKLKAIRIENLRGIKQSIDFPFKKSSNNTSLAIYGKNGTGKSSIVDAWEWLYNSKIEHLAREGAGEKDYPHKDSDGSNSYIELEFEGETDNVKVLYNPKKITQPVISGDYSALKKKIPHPLHLRYRDLQNFVYSTKVQKYEYLAKYLGFESALNVQKGLKNNIQALQSKLDMHQGMINENEQRIRAIIGAEVEINEENILKYINEIFDRHGIDRLSSFQEIKTSKDKLKKIVEDNPKTKELADWKEFKKLLDRFYPLTSFKTDVEKLDALFNDLQSDLSNLTNLIRVDLFDNALKVLEKAENNDCCPLCDQHFAGDLEKHIRDKHTSLEALKNKSQEFQTLSGQLESSLNELQIKIGNLLAFESEKVNYDLREFIQILNEINTELPSVVEKLGRKMTEIDRLSMSGESWHKHVDALIKNKEALYEKIESCIKKLDEDSSRKELTDDFTNVNELSSSFYRYNLNKKLHSILANQKNDFEEIYEKYTEWIKAEIQTAFDVISGNMVAYFDLLEDNHPYIKNPKIKLVADKDKAIELEIEFAGEELSPAYKVLSESQINSFGLAVFLSAIKHFNKDFKFIILDDVVNSFDAFKRPRVIELLNTHFSDYQLLVLTHDKLWYDWITRSFSDWNRMIFYGWDYKTGPKIEVGRSIFEQIEDDIAKDRANEAGQSLGKYLEWVLKLLNNNLQTPIGYKINGEYTLNELYEPFKKRVKDKLGSNHLVYKLLDEFETKTIFRNYCMHYKDTEFTASEIEGIFRLWEKIESNVWCSNCKQYIKYDNTSQKIECKCGTQDMRDAKYTAV